MNSGDTDKSPMPSAPGAADPAVSGHEGVRKFAIKAVAAVVSVLALSGCGISPNVGASPNVPSASGTATPGGETTPPRDISPVADRVPDEVSDELEQAVKAEKGKCETTVTHTEVLANFRIITAKERPDLSVSEMLSRAQTGVEELSDARKDVLFLQLPGNYPELYKDALSGDASIPLETYQAALKEFYKPLGTVVKFDWPNDDYDSPQANFLSESGYPLPEETKQNPNRMARIVMAGHMAQVASQPKADLFHTIAFGAVTTSTDGGIDYAVMTHDASIPGSADAVALYDIQDALPETPTPEELKEAFESARGLTAHESNHPHYLKMCGESVIVTDAKTGVPVVVDYALRRLFELNDVRYGLEMRDSLDMSEVTPGGLTTLDKATKTGRVIGVTSEAVQDGWDHNADLARYSASTTMQKKHYARLPDDKRDFSAFHEQLAYTLTRAQKDNALGYNFRVASINAVRTYAYISGRLNEFPPGSPEALQLSAALLQLDSVITPNPLTA